MIDKKKLKEQYKAMVPPKGVFIFKNNINGKVFLGSSLNLKGIESKIRLTLSTDRFFNSALQADWNESGPEAFSYEVVEMLELRDDPTYNYAEDLEILEMIWKDIYPPNSEKCYNKNPKIRMV